MNKGQEIKIISDDAYPGFRIGWSGQSGADGYRQILLNLVKKKRTDKSGQLADRPALGGRSSVKIFQIPGEERMVVKPFRRGGLFRFLVRDRYFRISGESRAQLEFTMLNLARKMGINAPEPLGFVEQGHFWYRCWLVTRLVPSAETLAALSLRDAEKAEAIMPRVMAQIEILIQNGMVHADLHPGNVLIRQGSENGQNHEDEGDTGVWLIDFDKACPQNIQPELLFRQYRKRWNRAVVKHRLPELLSRLFSRPPSTLSR